MLKKCWSENLKGRDHSERRRHRWDENTKMNRNGIGCKDVDWIHVAQDTVQLWAVVNMTTFGFHKSRGT
jgi:hypothetical protein